MPSAGKDQGVGGRAFYHYYGRRGKQPDMLCVRSFGISTSICGVNPMYVTVLYTGKRAANKNASKATRLSNVP